MKLTYTGEQPIEHTGLGLSWETGKTQEVPDAIGQKWKDDPNMPFTTPHTNAGKEAIAAGSGGQEPAAAEQTETEVQA